LISFPKAGLRRWMRLEASVGDQPIPLRVVATGSKAPPFQLELS